jgi:hypothetical protein
MRLCGPSAKSVQDQRPVRHQIALRHAFRLSPESANLRGLEIAFATQALRRLCQDEAAAQAALGVRVAAQLKARLADLDAADVFSDIAAGRPRPADSAEGLDVFLDLTRDTRLVLRVNHQKVPRRQDQVVDWLRVRRVQIMRIEAND